MYILKTKDKNKDVSKKINWDFRSSIYASMLVHFLFGHHIPDTLF